MKKIILIIIFLISVTSLAESQTRLKFGGVFLKDTLSGSMKLTSGDLWTQGFTYADGYYVGTNNKSLIYDSPATGNLIIENNWNVGNGDMIFSLFKTNADYVWNMTSGEKMTLGESTLAVVNNVTVGDNLTVDSILTLRSSATFNLISDDSVVTVTSTCMPMNSDDGTSTNRTFTLSDGTTAGQLLIIEWLGAVGSKEGEIVDAGSESGLNGTMTFDALDDTIMLKWNGTYWRELSRTEM